MHFLDYQKCINQLRKLLPEIFEMSIVLFFMLVDKYQLPNFYPFLSLLETYANQSYKSFITNIKNIKKKKSINTALYRFIEMAQLATLAQFFKKAVKGVHDVQYQGIDKYHILTCHKPFYNKFLCTQEYSNLSVDVEKYQNGQYSAQKAHRHWQEYRETQRSVE